ncbi:MAG: LacI family transcriptional regulator [Verrucomicrobia bacterium Tous-C9LFEB]|nr:MAG: LacI family transcriptional regulator [Verrucomicrobia bacterium Tous-C9LFEB]
MTKLKDIALAAGVSVDTVSRALNGKTKACWPSVARKAEDIRELARKMDYKPNRAAQMMRTQRTQQVGVLVSELYNPHTGLVLEAFGQSLERRGYGLVLGLCREPGDASLGKFVRNLLDGIINLHPQLSTADLSRLAPQLPIITYNRSVKESPAVYDMVQGMHMALNHLWSLGHRRIALVTGPHNPEHVASRITGYESFYARQTMAASPDWIIQTGWKLEDGEAAVESLLKTSCTACLGGNALLSIGLLLGLRRHHVQVPRDYSLFSLEDTFMTQISDPPITSITHPISKLVDATVEGLIALIEKKDIPPCASYPVTLVDRGSVIAMT